MRRRGSFLAGEGVDGGVLRFSASPRSVPPSAPALRALTRLHGGESGLDRPPRGGVRGWPALAAARRTFII